MAYNPNQLHVYVTKLILKQMIHDLNWYNSACRTEVLHINMESVNSLERNTKTLLQH